MTEISLQRARELLGDTKISDEELLKIINELRLFGNIIYSMHIATKEKQTKNNINDNSR